MPTQQAQPLDRTPDNAPPRRRTASVAVVVLVLITLGWALTRIGGNPPAAAPPAGPPAAAPPATSTTAVPEVSYQDLAGLELPASRTAGPRDTDAGRARGFAHNDIGAAFAAVHLLVRTFPFVGSTVFGPTIAEQVVGKDAAALARITDQAYAQTARPAKVNPGDPLRSEGGWVAGYRLDSPQTPDERTVRVLIRQVADLEAEGFTEYRVHLTWRDGDWRLIAPAWGDWRTAARAMTNADPARYLSYDPGRRA